MPPQPLDPKSVFLNIPYDQEFRSLYVAYTVGLCHLGFDPHIASEIPGGERRLERILVLVRSCRYSIHDLSRVELSATPPATPRFNMPLELGITITWAVLHPKRHTWFLWEAEPRRIQKSMSDLDGTDAYIHSGTAAGVLSELRNSFWRADAPTVPTMLETFRFVENCVDPILVRNGTQNLFAQSVFNELRWLSTRVAELLHPRSPRETP
jgi:hypothetical protein